MPRWYKVNACLTLVLAIVFFLFWQICKLQPALAQVATFTEDPYDAIGSLATQFAMFTALLSIIRAFRPYPSSDVVEHQQPLLVGSEYLTCLCVAVTLGSDIVAMVRYPLIWIGVPAGYELAALTGGMTLLTVLMGWCIHRTIGRKQAPSTHHELRRAIVVSLIGAIICAVYPQNWRENFPVGGWGTAFILSTGLLGMAIGYAALRTWLSVLTAPVERPREDFLDDLAALYIFFKRRLGWFKALLIPFEKTFGSSLLRSVGDWFNPRKDRWYAIALVGIIIGTVLAFSEGHMHPPLGLLRVFVVIECFEVLVGYVLFVNPLGLARHETTGNRETSSGVSS